MPELDTRTLSASYICTFLAAILIFVRLGLRYQQREARHIDDIWMAISLVPLLVRCGLIHIVLLYGTTSFDRSDFHGMSAAETKNRIIGSKSILAARIFYAGL
jgi:hypothetical protein